MFKSVICQLYRGGVKYLIYGTYDEKYPKGGVVSEAKFEKYPWYFFDRKIGCRVFGPDFEKYQGTFLTVSL